MPRPDESTRLIASAAKAALTPLGCMRMGKSRTWISDQGYWLIVIAFQPSSWEKGTYLQVGAMWLWRARKGLAFNVGHRIADFLSFDSAEQFAPRIEHLAMQAAREVGRLRDKFRSLFDIYRYLLDHTSENNPDIFHTAIAASLIGEVDTARRLFKRFAEMPTHGYQWAITLHEVISQLASQVDDHVAFRSAALAIIQECRLLNNLPSDEHCLDFLDTVLTIPKC